MRLAALILVLLVGCAHDPLDTAAIGERATEERNRVNALSDELSALATPIMMFCGLVGDDDARCEALRSAYDVGRGAVITAQRYIDAFAKTGQGLAIVEAGVTVIEAAVMEVRAETERLMQEVREHVASAGNAGDEGGGAAGAADPETSGQPGAAAEGEGSAEAAEPGGMGEGAPAEGAREVGADASGEEGQ